MSQTRGRSSAATGAPSVTAVLVALVAVVLAALLATTTLVPSPAVATEHDEPATEPAAERTADEAPTEPATAEPTPDVPASDEPAAPRAPLSVRASVRGVGPVSPDVQIHGSGWGHGVGMSQYGAYAKALVGHTAEAILTHYYQGTQVTTDTRATTGRIRVSILDQVPSTTVEAVERDVPWLRCRPDAAAGETVGGRVSDCEPWFVQAQGTTLRACAFRGQDDAGIGRDGIRVVLPDALGGCAADAVHETVTHPIARVDHDGSVIRTPSHVGTTPYRHGWRDLHSRVGASGSVLNSVQDIPSVERYLRGLAEVPSSWGRTGRAALEAQAITGRTFALGRLGSVAAGCACNLRATPADQNFTGYAKESETIGSERIGDLWVDAVDATTDLVLTYEGQLAQTFYSSSHGGRTENIEDSWAYGTSPIPYLRSTDDPWSLDPVNPRAQWTANVSNGAMAAFLSTGRQQPITRVVRLRVLTRTDGGTPRDLEVTGTTADGQRVTFTFAGRPNDPKPIAGASLRRYLPIAEGGTGGRLFSSQLSRFGFLPFTDDDGHIHEASITWAYEAGVVRGVEPTRFAPNRSVTRAQMATYLVNTFEVPTVVPVGRFADVAAGDTHAASIEALAALGVVSGYPGGTFRPDQPVTRAQMATFLAGALALRTDVSGSFDDVAGGVHDAAIEAIAQAGITTGCAPARFCPSDPVQRGQLAAFLERVVLG